MIWLDVGQLTSERRSGSGKDKNKDKIMRLRLGHGGSGGESCYNSYTGLKSIGTIESSPLGPRHLSYFISSIVPYRKRPF